MDEGTVTKEENHYSMEIIAAKLVALSPRELRTYNDCLHTISLKVEDLMDRKPDPLDDSLWCPPPLALDHAMFLDSMLIVMKRWGDVERQRLDSLLEPQGFRLRRLKVTYEWIPV